MYPIVEKEKSIFVKCKYNEREKLFEGHLPKDVSSADEREVSIASVIYQPKLLSEKKPIEIGVAFGEGGNALFRIEKGRFGARDYNLIKNYHSDLLNSYVGEWNSTSIRRKSQVLTALDRVLLQCQVYNLHSFISIFSSLFSENSLPNVDPNSSSHSFEFYKWFIGMRFHWPKYPSVIFKLYVENIFPRKWS